MSEWYYADAARHRQGPLSAADLTQRFHQRTIRLDTLVWRDGLPQWQPLRDFSEELALHQAPAETFYNVADSGMAPVATGNGGATIDSPYAPPAAELTSTNIVHAGGEVVHAGLWKRFAASIIDSFVTGILSYLVLIPLMLALGLGMGSLLGTAEAMAGGVGLLFNLLMYPISIGIPALYFGWMHASSRQASLGKMAVDIKVVRSNGEPISFWRGFLRYVAYMLFTLVTCGLGVIISGLMVAFSERKQALHDMICDTLVVDKWAFTAHPEWQRHELGTVTVVVLAIGGLLIVGTIAVMVFAIGMAASMAR